MPDVHDATPDDFDALVFEPRDRLVVVDFWGPRCPNCEVFAADVPRLMEALGDAPVRIVKVDAYAHASLATRFGLKGIPTFLLVRDGKVLGRMSQYHGFEYWLAVVRENLGAG